MDLMIIAFVVGILLAIGAQKHRPTSTTARRRRARQRYFLEH